MLQEQFENFLQTFSHNSSAIKNLSLGNSDSPLLSTLKNKSPNFSHQQLQGVCIWHQMTSYSISDGSGEPFFTSGQAFLIQRRKHSKKHILHFWPFGRMHCWVLIQMNEENTESVPAGAYSTILPRVCWMLHIINECRWKTKQRGTEDIHYEQDEVWDFIVVVFSLIWQLYFLYLNTKRTKYFLYCSHSLMQIQLTFRFTLLMKGALVLTCTTCTDIYIIFILFF